MELSAEDYFYSSLLNYCSEMGVFIESHYIGGTK